MDYEIKRWMKQVQFLVFCRAPVLAITIQLEYEIPAFMFNTRITSHMRNHNRSAVAKGPSCFLYCIIENSPSKSSQALSITNTLSRSELLSTYLHRWQKKTTCCLRTQTRKPSGGYMQSYFLRSLQLPNRSLSGSTKLHTKRPYNTFHHSRTEIHPTKNVSLFTKINASK